MRDAGLSKHDVGVYADLGEQGGGFLQEWHTGMISARTDTHSKNIPGLHSGFGLLAMDLILGQSDRHNGNFAIHATNGKVVAFDNGANGRFAEIKGENQRGKGLVKWELWRDRDPSPYGHTTSNTPRLKSSVPTGMDESVFIDEFDDWFDDHFDMDTVLDVAEACNMQVVGELMDGTKVTTEVIKERLRDYALTSYGFRTNNQGYHTTPAWFNPGPGAKVNTDAPPPARGGAKVTVEGGIPPDASAPGTDPQQRMPFTDLAAQMGATPGQHRGDTVSGEFREVTPNGTPIQSSKDSRPEFKVIKQRYE